VSPALILGALLVLIGAQVTRVVAPRQGSYVVAFVLAAAGFVAAELFAIATHIGGPGLGALHPLADVAGIAAAELLGWALLPAPRQRL